ncbi:MAG: MFS transporter, partial [Gammaproteobacteria bacterium]|nr:MFS transporter [Gammaproteobacteria bacterium]
RTRASARGESSSNPLPHIRRFFAQPRLRLAWFITLARTAWWSTFFIYTPIYAVSVGMSESTGGALVSLGVAMVYTVTLWASLGRRYGFRLLCIGGFAATGLASLVVPLFGVTPTAAAAVLIFAAFCAASLDGVGHITYLRAVRPREREIMAGVYGTYRDAAQLLPPGIFAIVLAIASLPAVFGTAGLWMLITAWYARHVPKGLR